MTSTALNSRASRGFPTDKALVAIAFVLALATIAGAWGSQIFGGLVPCELCLEQRLAYYAGLPVLALVLVLWNRLPLAAWYVLMAAGVVIFIWSTYMGGFHAGVELGYWPGPTACTGTGGGLSFSDLNAGTVARVVGCDVVQFRFLGITLAGYNALISALLVVLLLAAIVVQARRRRG